ncbi:MAG: TolC family protein [Acidobacteria bacterium]|nr:TolC family protein [Acidobacteriota bacterium]
MHLRILASSIVMMGLAFTEMPAQTRVSIPENLTLEAAKSLLISYNPTLQAERLNVDIEAGDVIDAEKRPNPSFSVGSEGLSFGSSDRSFFSNQELSLELRQDIETAGKRQKRTRLEEADVEIADIEVQDLVRLLIFEAKTVYYQVVLAQEDLTLARDILDQFVGVVNLNRIRYESGEIAGGELRRVEAAQYQFYEDVVAAEVGLENAQDRLLALLGSTDFDQSFKAVDSFDSQFVPPPPQELRDTALRERADLAAQRAQITRSDFGIELEKARGVPNISPFVGYRRDFGDNGAIVGIEIPLFVSNRNQGGIARAQAQRRRQEQLVRLAEVRALQEVQLALNELEGNRRRIEALQGEYLNKARQSRDIAESAYRLGGASLIEFLDAERTYRETSRLYNRVLYDFQISRGQLELAIGKDLQP